MFIDISDHKQIGNILSFNFNDKLEFEDLSNSYIGLDSLTLKGQLECLDIGEYFLTASLKADIKLSCDRCLDELVKKIEIEIEEHYSYKTLDSTEEEEEYFFSERIIDRSFETIIFSANKIDLKPLVKTQLILAIPVKVLCVDDCKGLCKFCGQNLNVSTCDCEDDYLDPRFADLFDIFEK